MKPRPIRDLDAPTPGNFAVGRARGPTQEPVAPVDRDAFARAWLQGYLIR